MRASHPCLAGRGMGRIGAGSLSASSSRGLALGNSTFHGGAIAPLFAPKPISYLRSGRAELRTQAAGRSGFWADVPEDGSPASAKPVVRRGPPLAAIATPPPKADEEMTIEIPRPPFIPESTPPEIVLGGTVLVVGGVVFKGTSMALNEVKRRKEAKKKRKADRKAGVYAKATQRMQERREMVTKAAVVAEKTVEEEEVARVEELMSPEVSADSSSDSPEAEGLREAQAELAAAEAEALAAQLELTEAMGSMDTMGDDLGDPDLRLELEAAQRELEEAQAEADAARKEAEQVDEQMGTIQIKAAEEAKKAEAAAKKAEEEAMAATAAEEEAKKTEEAEAKAAVLVPPPPEEKEKKKEKEGGWFGKKEAKEEAAPTGAVHVTPPPKEEKKEEKKKEKKEGGWFGKKEEKKEAAPTGAVLVTPPPKEEKKEEKKKEGGWFGKKEEKKEAVAAAPVAEESGAKKGGGIMGRMFPKKSVEDVAKDEARAAERADKAEKKAEAAKATAEEKAMKAGAEGEAAAADGEISVMDMKLSRRAVMVGGGTLTFAGLVSALKGEQGRREKKVARQRYERERKEKNLKVEKQRKAKGSGTDSGLLAVGGVLAATGVGGVAYAVTQGKGDGAEKAAKAAAEAASVDYDVAARELEAAKAELKAAQVELRAASEEAREAGASSEDEARAAADLAEIERELKQLEDVESVIAEAAEEMSAAVRAQQDASTQMRQGAVPFPVDAPPPIAAAGLVLDGSAAERVLYKPGGLALAAGAAAIPHPEKMAKGGEDAFFISGPSGMLGGVAQVPGGNLNGALAVGVADGVSAWGEEGVDPSAYSRELMQAAGERISKLDLEGASGSFKVSAGSSSPRALERTPTQALSQAQSEVYSPGSSTACVARVDGRKLQVANVGDSGFIVMRRGEVVLKSSPQQHFFNCPYQLSHPEVLPETDTAEDAEAFELDLEVGDLVVMASDGLWDNVYDDEVVGIAGKYAARNAAKATFDSEASSAQEAARALAEAAARNAQDTKLVSPWADALTEEFVPGWMQGMGRREVGGKVDDCTVVVAVVTEAPSSSFSVPMASGSSGGAAMASM